VPATGLVTVTAVVLATVSVVPPGARAQIPDRRDEGRLRGERSPRLQDFWRRPGPDKQRAARRLDDALGLLRRAVDEDRRRHPITKPGLYRRARQMLVALTRTHPKEVRFWYWRGFAAHLVRDEDATLKAWMQVWRRAPYHWSIPDVAFSLGVILAKRGRFADSVKIYQHGMPLSARLSTRGIMASNCAESAMAIGKLRLAEHLYRESLRLRPRKNDAAWWGLMVALDRQGLTLAAERAARRALLLDPSLQGLQGPSVFFVPPGDVHYYLALAHEAKGDLKEALRQWKRFVRKRPQSRYRSRAREHLRRLKAVVARYKPRASLVRVIPRQAHQQVARLLPRVARCYRRRAKTKPVPEGPVALVLRLRQGRIRRVSRGFVPSMITDAALQRCLRRALRRRRIGIKGHPRIFATFYLERAP
jgi:tetratricopeptide (TPR) repeat protein